MVIALLVSAYVRPLMAMENVSKRQLLLLPGHSTQYAHKTVISYLA